MLVVIIGGGLAGTEAALTLAAAGVDVRLYEMRPGRMTPAHTSGGLAELVCSNSLKSEAEDSASGMLKSELRLLGSPVLAAAKQARVPAGRSLAVDRARFSEVLTARVEADPRIRLVREELTTLPRDVPTILCPGPLASDALMNEVETLVGKGRLFFFDAIAPVVDAGSLDMEKLFPGSRYEEGVGDYLNAGMDQPTYSRFVRELLAARQFVPHGFDATDKLPLFSGCQPIEAIASGGWLSLAHGPMRPTGLGPTGSGDRLRLRGSLPRAESRGGRRDAATSLGWFAVVQLRAENVERTAYNLVGFQTRLVQSEQKRVFRMIPGLENAEFLRFGSLHRNSYIDSPRLLHSDLGLRALPSVMVAGQFAGAEGYCESTALGALAARFVLARLASGDPLRALPDWDPTVRVGPTFPPRECALGALWAHVTRCPSEPLQPGNIHFGMFPGPSGKREQIVHRAREAFLVWLEHSRPFLTRT